MFDAEIILFDPRPLLNLKGDQRMKQQTISAIDPTSYKLMNTATVQIRIIPLLTTVWNDMTEILGSLAI